MITVAKGDRQVYRLGADPGTVHGAQRPRRVGAAEQAKKTLAGVVLTDRGRQPHAPQRRGFSRRALAAALARPVRTKIRSQ